MAKKTEVTDEQKLQLALDTIRKAHGNNSVLTGSDSIAGVEFLSSGCLSLDKALGGGWARGRVSEIYGPESSGKTTLTLHAIAEAQKLGEKCAFIDVEHAFDPIYAEALGINVEELLFSQPSSGEEALQIVEMLAKSGVVKVIVVDSVAALLPRAEIEKEIGDSTVGRQAGLMSQAMRKLPAVCAKTGTTLLFINQIRMKIGIMFGNPETTSGGNALKFYASQRVDIRRKGGVKEGEDLIANETRVKVAKNKVAPPFKSAEFQIKYGEGIDTMLDLLRIAVEANLIKKSGAWFSYEGDNIGQGESRTVLYLKEHPELVKTLKAGLQ